MHGIGKSRLRLILIVGSGLLLLIGLFVGILLLRLSFQSPSAHTGGTGRTGDNQCGAQPCTQANHQPSPESKDSSASTPGNKNTPSDNANTNTSKKSGSSSSNGTGTGGTGEGSSGGGSPSTPYVQPGTVGYLGDVNSLAIVDQTHSLAGCTWNSGEGTACSGDNLTLDHVYIKGALYWRGTGSLTITNSIVEGAGDKFYAVFSASAGAASVTVSDSTLRMPDGVPYPSANDEPPVFVNGTGALKMYRNNIYAFPQGIDLGTDNSVADSNWIHDLAYNASDPHLDGIFVFNGQNITVPAII